MNNVIFCRYHPHSAIQLFLKRKVRIVTKLYVFMDLDLKVNALCRGIWATPARENNPQASPS